MGYIVECTGWYAPREVSPPHDGELQAISKSTEDRFGINAGKHQASCLTDLLTHVYINSPDLRQS